MVFWEINYSEIIIIIINLGNNYCLNIVNVWINLNQTKCEVELNFREKVIKFFELNN